MIVVTGASGSMGRLVAERLAAREQPMRLLVRDPARAPTLPGAEPVTGDYNDRDSLEAALHEGDRVFMVSLHEGHERRLAGHRAFIDACARRRVGVVVYLSFVAAGPDAIFYHARSHGATERMLRDSGLPHACIRNGMYADDVLSWFDEDGIIREPGGDGRISFSYRPELADAIAAVLADPGIEPGTYTVVGEPVSMAELAAVATAADGRPHSYQPFDDAWWEARWRSRGKQQWEIDAGLSSYAALRAGEFDVTSDDYQRLTGRLPRSLAEVILEQLAAGGRTLSR